MKKFLSLFLVLALMLSLTACGGSKTPVESTDAPQTSDFGPSERVPYSDPKDHQHEVADPADDSYGGSDSDPGFTGDSETEGKGPRPLIKDTMAGERYICEEFFDVRSLNSDDVVGLIGEEISDYIGPSATADLGLILSMYSIEGLHRDLAYGDESYEAARKAAVVACWLLSIPYEELWENGYMPEEDAQEIIAVLTADSVG